MELSAEAVQALQAGRRQVMAGWCQGQMWGDYGAVCVFGALRKGCGSHRAIFDALYALEDEAGLAHADEGEIVAIAAWNDAPERTLADVVALFDRVLAKAASRDFVKS